MSPLKPSRRMRLDRHGGRDAAAGVDAGGGDTQLEVRLRTAHAQAVGIVEAALVLAVGDVQRVRSFRGQLQGDVGVGVMGQESRGFVLRVVVDGEFLALGVGQAEDRIERRPGAAGDDLGDDLVPGFARRSGRRPLRRAGRCGRPRWSRASASSRASAGRRTVRRARLLDRDPVNEVLAAAIDGVLDFDACIGRRREFRR